MLLLCFSSQAPILSFSGHCRHEHLRELAGAGAPGTSLRLEITILTPQTQRQVLVMAIPTDCIDGDIAGEHEIPEDTDWDTPDLGRLKMNQLLPLVALALSRPEKALRWLLSQLLRYSFCTVCWTGIKRMLLALHECEGLVFPCRQALHRLLCY